MNKQKLPRPSPLFTRLFQWLCNADYFEELQGDLEEYFFRDLEAMGEAKAQAIYRIQILKMMRPSVVRRPLKLQKLIMLSLFYMNFKLAFRNLIRHKVFSAVNVFGLAAALSVCLFMVNLIYTGFNYDRQHEDLGKLYRIENVVEQENVSYQTQYATVPYPAVAQLKMSIPDVEMLCHITKNATTVFDMNGVDLPTFGIATEPAFFEMFNFKTIHGNVQEIFNDVNSIAITEDVAERVFNGEYPIGKVTKDQKVIRAVIESPKGSSHMQFEIISALPDVSIKANGEAQPYSLSWADVYSNYAYVKLKEESDANSLSQRLQLFSASVNRLNGLENSTFSFRAKPVKGLAFGEPVMNEIGIVIGREGFITFAIMIAVLMLIAGFNYTNLSIARAVQRTKEIGIRKVSGSTNGQIAGQILAETMIFSFLGLLLGVGIYRYYSDDFVANLPFFSGLFNPKLDLNILLTFGAFAAFTGLMAGLFPALHFARINPLSLFNGQVKNRRMSIMWVRRGLTTFQLTLSMFCVVFVTMLYQQAQLIKNTSQGIETENRLLIRTQKKEAALLKPLVEKIAAVKSSTLLSNIPGHAMGPTMAFYQLETADSSTNIQFFFADEHFDDVLAPKLLEGRFFNSASTSEGSREVLVNRKLLQIMNIDFEQAVGKSLKSKDGNLTIVGVVGDIAIGNPFNHSVEPMMIVGANSGANQGVLIANINEQNQDQTLAQLEAAWKEVHPEARFEPEFLKVFLDKPIDEFINLIKAQGFMSFAIIAISLLGQLGISLYNAETRVKEIGIRKVLGAKISSIIRLLLKGTIIPLIIAGMVASPIAYLLFQDGIAQDMRTPLEIGPGIFIQSLLLLGALVTGVVVSQTWRVASLNPTESLRAE